ncbi:MAG TPA: Hsp33 family molecular chaperone HslO [Casimicrobiaceae bacterium]|nr:Hsp33 family molecular chaperone HslO [Casimicrobiaceae bacterium]
MEPRFEDELTRFVFERAAVRGAVVSLDATYRDILACHPYPPGLQRLIGETLAAVCLLANSLKFKGSLILQLHGGGKLRLLVVECSAALELRATAQWEGEIDVGARLSDLAGGEEASRMVLTLDPKDGGALYQGVVALEGASVAALFEHYLAKSEQIESRLWLRAGSGCARGVLLQRMPSSTDADAATWRRAAGAVAEASAASDAGDAHAVLRALFPSDDLRAFRPRRPRFGCSCTRERVAAALRLLGSDEVESILAERGWVGVDCEFCNRRYEFDAAEARSLFAAPSAAIVH